MSTNELDSPAKKDQDKCLKEKLDGRLADKICNKDCWLIGYSILVFLSVVCLGVTVFCLSYQLMNKSKNLHTLDVQPSGIEKKANSADNPSLLIPSFKIDYSNTSSQNIIWLIVFLTLIIFVLVLSIPIFWSSRTQRYMTFYLDKKELESKKE